MDYTIRLAQIGDVPEIANIEKCTSAEPWSEQALLNDVVNNDKAVVIVAESDGRLLGYTDVWQVADELQLNNIGVLKEYRGNHIGQDMLNIVIKTAGELHCKLITLEVRESNNAARKMYNKSGFKEVGVREHYYENNNENAILMDLNI